MLIPQLKAIVILQEDGYDLLFSVHDKAAWGVIAFKRLVLSGSCNGTALSSFPYCLPPPRVSFKSRRGAAEMVTVCRCFMELLKQTDEKHQLIHRESCQFHASIPVFSA